MLSANPTPLTSAPTPVPTVVVGASLSPVKFLALLLPRESPLVTSVLVDVLRASTEVDPEETTPVTWPPTAEPVLELPDWLDVDRLFPDWTLSPLEPVTFAACATPAEAKAPVTTSAAASSILIVLVICFAPPLRPNCP